MARVGVSRSIYSFPSDFEALGRYGESFARRTTPYEIEVHEIQRRAEGVCEDEVKRIAFPAVFVDVDADDHIESCLCESDACSAGTAE